MVFGNLIHLCAQDRKVEGPQLNVSKHYYNLSYFFREHNFDLATLLNIFDALRVFQGLISMSLPTTVLNARYISQCVTSASVRCLLKADR